MAVDRRPDIRLLLSDVDGTLVTREKLLTEAARAAVRELADAGVGFTIVSSRPPRGMRRLVDPLRLRLPFAGFNGGLILNPDLSLVEAHPLDPAAAARTVGQLLEHGLDVWIYGQDQWFVRDAAAPHVAREAWILGFDPTVLDDFAEPHMARAFKIVGVSDAPERMPAAEEDLRGALGAAVSATRSAGYFLDVTNPLASKAKVVDSLSRRLRIAPAQVATIGDMPNDVLMFRASGYSIAMGNASDAVKSAADAVTDSNENDGFAKAVRGLILGGASRFAQETGGSS